MLAGVDDGEAGGVEAGAVAVEVIAEVGGAGDVVVELFEPAPGLLGEEDAAGPESTGYLGWRDRFVAAEDEVEAGEWRIELLPATRQQDDVFLVVLIPTLLGEPTRHQVRLLERDGLIGCEITTSKRTTRWWFQEGRNGTQVEIVEGGTTKRVDARGDR